MNANFNQRLLGRIKDQSSHLCVGLDPDPKLMTPAVREASRRVVEKVQASRGLLPERGRSISESVARVALCHAVVSLCEPYAAAFKPNSAFFETDRSGLVALQGVSRFLAAAAPGAVSIYDAKRGDIGNTSAKYADAGLVQMGFDSITVNPLMGLDSVEPFLDNPENGVFLLCLTSNSGAADFLLQNELYKRIAEKAVQWNRNGNVGLVVGATRAEHAAAVREIAPDLPLLIPGVGAQGGSLTEILDAINARNNPGFLINASRSIMFPAAEEGSTWEQEVQAAAKSLCGQIQEYLGAEAAPA